MSRRLTVELVEEEAIVARGARRVRWRVANAEGWVDAATAPGARTQALEKAPGVVWRRRIELDLVAGTRLERQVLEPAEPRRRDVLEHLSRDRRGTEQRLTTTRYVVEADGSLGRDASSP